MGAIDSSWAFSRISGCARVNRKPILHHPCVSICFKAAFSTRPGGATYYGEKRV
jgi:hypothetical protein